MLRWIYWTLYNRFHQDEILYFNIYARDWVNVQPNRNRLICELRSYRYYQQVSLHYMGRGYGLRGIKSPHNNFVLLI